MSDSIPFTFKLRRFLWRWHRRVGLTALVFVVVLSVTGIFLNHTGSLALSAKPLPSWLAASAYGVQPSVSKALPLGDAWLVQLQDGSLYLNESPLPGCQGPLLSGYRVDAQDQNSEWLLLVCRLDSLVLTEAGEIIERWADTSDWYRPVSAGWCTDSPCLTTQTQVYQYHQQSVEWVSVEVDDFLPIHPDSSKLPDSLKTNLLDRHRDRSISWERFLLDVHSGRVLGDLGVLLVDLMALLFVFLGGSGLVVWWIRRNPR